MPGKHSSFHEHDGVDHDGSGGQSSPAGYDRFGGRDHVDMADQPADGRDLSAECSWKGLGAEIFETSGFMGGKDSGDLRDCLDGGRYYPAFYEMMGRCPSIHPRQ